MIPTPGILSSSFTSPVPRCVVANKTYFRLHIGKLLAEADKRDIPCTNPQHPDGFSYIDLSNVRREITNMTKEVHDQVMGHYRNGDYIILNKMATAASV